MICIHGRNSRMTRSPSPNDRVMIAVQLRLGGPESLRHEWAKYRKCGTPRRESHRTEQHQPPHAFGA